MFYQIGNISSETKELVKSIELDTGTVDLEIIQGWIMNILEDIEPEDIRTVTYFLLTNERNKENLLKVYSFVSDRFNEKMNA